MSDATSTASPLTGERKAGFMASLPAGLGPVVSVTGAWIVLILASGLHRSDFLSHQTLLAVTFTMAIVGVLAVAQALIGTSGAILDLSQPTALTLTAAVVSQLLTMGWPLPLVLLIGIIAGALWGLLNALIVVVGKLNPIIVTLGTNFIGTALMLLIYQHMQAPITSPLVGWGQGSFLGLPNIWWPMVVLVLITGYFLPRTVAGRHAIAVGGNRFAAQSRGISLKKTRFAIFTLAGAISGLAGIMFAASTGPFQPASGTTFQLPVIAGIILAGVSLAGGRGSIWMILLSVGLLSTVPTSLVFFGFSSNWQAVFQGLILIAAVAVDGWRAKRRLR